MENYSSTYGSRSRRAGSGEVARTPVTCEAGPSTGGSVDELSYCNAIIDKAVVAGLLSRKLQEHFGKSGEKRDPTPQEQTISERLFKTVRELIENELFGWLDIVIESNISDNRIDSNLTFRSDQDWEYEEPPRKKCTEDDQVPIEIMRKAVEAYNKAKKNKLKAAQHHSRKATNYSIIQRWKEYLGKGGTEKEKINIIKEYMSSQFFHHRAELKVAVHDRDLKMWAMEKAFELGLHHFKACSKFILTFKNENKITSRKVTHIVTKRDLFPDISLQPLIDDFRCNLKKMIEQRKCKLSNILNTDQSGFNYEIVSNRTLDMTGNKNVDMSVISKNKTTHSYTIQMTISAAGTFVGPLLIITQETKGMFGPKVKQNLQNIPSPNLLIRCSKSGKSTKEITAEYFQKLKESIGDENTLLVLDSWSGQKDESIWIRNLGFNVEPLFLPPGTTKYLQPLDVYFFQNYKYMVKRIVEYSKTHTSICGDIDITSRDGIIQTHSLAYNQFSCPTFNQMRQYAFQKALIRNTDPVFRSVKQVCFTLTNNTCDSCGTMPFIVCAWCWKHLCF